MSTTEPCYTDEKQGDEKMIRVYALYRVSTAKQVDHVACGNTTKDDIPMQRIACHNFAERQQDWEIICEFEEKGVSGFKVIPAFTPSSLILLSVAAVSLQAST